MSSHYKTVEELGQMLRAGETTPTQLAQEAMERLDSVGRQLNAVVTITEERALREAKNAEREMKAGIDRGPLHGIPYGAKDLLAAVGYPTTWGAAPYKDQVFDEDATVVRKLRDAGAVLVSKLAMIELAGGAGYEQPNASFTGPCKVPWNQNAWSGGSSSGSGSAIASGCVAFAIGSETAGSIHSPANNCGTTGIRPTYGRVSRSGAMALSWTMDKLGPMARTAHDCGLVLDAIAGADPADPSSLSDNYQYPNASVPNRPWRFAVVESEVDSSDDDVAANFRASVEILSQFGSVDTIELPEHPYSEVTALVIRAEMASAFEDAIRSGELRGLTAPEDGINPYTALAIPAVDYLRAMRLRGAMCRDIDALFSGYDAILTPTMPRVAPPIDQRFDAFDSSRRRRTFGSAVNITGVPGIAVVNGFGERGLPTSLCITGRAGSENALIEVAKAFQAETDWHTKTPEI
jgi:Asp-tRNA(Asn)/Glu-tRNA(Gln) amidotransferase A subunit family amidase